MQPPQVMRALIGPPYLGPERTVGSVGCGPIVPPLAIWWRQVSAVLHVRIVSSVSFHNNRYDDEELYVDTSLQATILEVFKRHPGVSDVGDTITMLVPGGRRLSAAGPVRHVMNNVPPPQTGTEWIVFLDRIRNSDAFHISYYERGAFRVRDGKVISVGWRATGPGADQREFVRALRKQGRVKLPRS